MRITGELRFHVTGGREAFLRFIEEDECFTLDLILVPVAARSQGVGTLLLERFLQLANGTGKPVRLVARPVGQSGPGVLARLERYYERFGFVETERRIASTVMVRAPR